MTTASRPCSRCGSPVLARTGSKVFCDTCRRPERTCAMCGASFTVPFPHSRRVTCSEPCRFGLRTRSNPETYTRTGSDHPSWKGGHRGYRGPGWQRIRDEIRERDGWTCQECGAGQAAGVRMDVHHFVPAEDWTRPGRANDPDNLVTLCVDCHAQKHWDGSWAGRRVSPELRAERDAARRKAAYERNRESNIANAARWNRENRERRNARERARRAARRATD